jgi:hypothetical protein
MESRLRADENASRGRIIRVARYCLYKGLPLHCILITKH